MKHNASAVSTNESITQEETRKAAGSRKSKLDAIENRDRFIFVYLAKYIKPHRPLLIISALLLFGAICIQLIRPLLIKQVIDVGIATHQMGYIIQYAVYYVLLIMVGIVVLFLQNYCLQIFGQRVIYEIRNTVFTKIIGLSDSDFSSMPVGNLVTRITNDIESLRTLYAEVLLKLTSAVLQIGGILTFMYILNVELAIVATCMIPVFMGILFGYQKYARSAFRGVRSKIAASNTSVQEMLNLIVMIKSYVGEVIMERSYDKISREFLAAGLFEVKTFAIFRPIVDGLLLVAIIIIFIATDLAPSWVEAGTVFAFLQYLDRLFQPIKDIAEKYNSLQSAMAGAERLVPILELENTKSLTAVEVPSELYPVETIEFDHVSFTYEGSEEASLEDVSFIIRRGEYIGIVGESGAGKTTLMSLLMGTHKPTKGTIRINGHDLSHYDETLIRSLVGFVLQNTHLFKGTIKENIALYDDTIPMEHIVEAAKKAKLHESIMKLVDNYNTPIGYLGSWLSEGEKQLLAMARTLLANRDVLVLDEATAHMDSHTEQVVQESMETMRGEKTIIAIAHRLSTIEHADTILVMQRGRLVEQGNYQSLLAQQGIFKRLYEAKHAAESTSL